MATWFRVSLVFFILLAAAASAQSIADARDMAARAKTLQLEASAALGRGDRDTWSAKSGEALRLLREAALLYRTAGVESSEDASLLSEYAIVLELSRDFDLAADAYAFLTDIEPDAAEWHLKRGLALMEVGPLQRKQAKESLESALQLNPGSEWSAEASAALGQIYWDASHYDVAAQYAERGYGGEPDDITAATNLAAARVRSGRMNEAESILTGLRSFRGDEFARSQSKIAQALLEFDQTRGWFDDTLENHLAYARLLIRVGRHPDAVLPLRRAVMLDPDNVATINLLGSVLRQTGDNAGARAVFEHSLQLDPNQPELRESLNALD